MNQPGMIGFTCAYTPLALIDAAGFSPYRILPLGDCPDQAGHLLHDNLCPTIKRILDRALSKDLPDLSGIVFVNSCDAMRRLADAWTHIRPDEPILVLDLPATTDDRAVSFFSEEIQRMYHTLYQWQGKPAGERDILKSIELYNELSGGLKQLADLFHSGKRAGGTAEIQKIYNAAATSSFDVTRKRLKKMLDAPAEEAAPDNRVPVYLFGNVMADPDVFSMIESCGAKIANDDFCTGSRMFMPILLKDGTDLFQGIARSILKRPPCARTFDPGNPGKIAEDVLLNANACSARGVIGHTIKFCDPYLERMPFVRDLLKENDIPFLLLEGDCTLRSMGQHRTRIEAFIEMLG